MHWSPGGDGHCHSYQGSSSSPALWRSQKKKKKEIEEKCLRRHENCFYWYYNLRGQCCTLTLCLFCVNHNEWKMVNGGEIPPAGWKEQYPDLWWLTSGRIMRPTVTLKNRGERGRERPYKTAHLPSRLSLAEGARKQQLLIMSDTS